ncbi:hypothetical protein HOY82DRAFT_294827 [Tuber indicum]|nr:hypothetical protein HOY82DRAFT_294827 [Tuber indicum]
MHCIPTTNTVPYRYCTLASSITAGTISISTTITIVAPTLHRRTTSLDTPVIILLNFPLKGFTRVAGFSLFVPMTPFSKVT